LIACSAFSSSVPLTTSVVADNTMAATSAALNTAP
jgi:hypothetical protein